MIDKQYIYDNVLPYIKQNGRKIEYYLILNLFKNKEEEILDELSKFQNPDGGFGYGLESDILTPSSNVACTDVAISYLDEIKDEKLKLNMIKDIIEYYEKSYNNEIQGWYLVNSDVDDYPHAIWWDYDKRDTFGYGNPNPEIVGFLYQYKEYLNHLDINFLVSKIINYINNDFVPNGTDHCLYSVLEFYRRVDISIKRQIENKILQKIHRLISINKEEWESYVCEPYKIFKTKNSLGIKLYKTLLLENIDYHINILKENDYIPINWSWYQYDSIFEEQGKKYGISKITYYFLKQLVDLDLL